MAGVTTQGSRLDRSDDSGATFTQINCAIGLTTPSADLAEQDATCLGSTAKEFIAGLPDNGEISVSINFDGGDSTHQQMLADSVSGVDLTWRIAVPESTAGNFTTAVFRGYAKGFSEQIDVDSIQVMSGAVRVNGAVTWAHGVTAL